jgi:hypothetical protein
MNRSEVVSWMRSLADKQFVELFYESVEGRSIYHELERSHLEQHFVLASATRALGDDDQWEEWEIELVAKHDDQEYPEGWSDDVPICQSGHYCGHETVSWAKHLICPACGEKGYGT